MLQFINATDRKTGKVVAFSREDASFVEALAAQAAVALENHHLMAAQNDLIDAMVRILAGAIDAKSAHTGGHCERVPQLAMMLAEEACRVDSGPLVP